VTSLDHLIVRYYQHFHFNKRKSAAVTKAVSRLEKENATILQSLSVVKHSSTFRIYIVFICNS